MKICVLSKEDGSGGGASVVAEQLASIYTEKGHHSEHYHFGMKSNVNVYGFFKPLIKKFKKFESKMGYRDHFPIEIVSNRLRNIEKKFDVLHIHDTSTVISHRMVAWLADRIPTIWTIHDCSVFTAGCLYPYSCDHFTNICNNCPQLSDWPINLKIDKTNEMHLTRREVLKSRIRFTAPSEWMIDQYESAHWPKSKISYIQNGVDLNIFKKYDKVSSLNHFSLKEPAGPIFLFSAGWLHDRRKGCYEVRDFIKSLSYLRPTLFLVGRYSDEAADIFSELDVVHFGFIRDNETRAKIYSICDATLMFSISENAPLTAIESLAVGTPVFGYAAGGLSSIITNDVTGFVSLKHNLSECIEKFEMHFRRGLDVMRSNCIAIAGERHDWKKISEHYINLMRTIMMEQNHDE